MGSVSGSAVCACLLGEKALHVVEGIIVESGRVGPRLRVVARRQHVDGDAQGRIPVAAAAAVEPRTDRDEQQHPHEQRESQVAEKAAPRHPVALYGYNRVACQGPTRNAPADPGATLRVQRARSWIRDSPSHQSSTASGHKR